MRKNAIVFWGTPPPPFGGMTVHINRLSLALKQEGWTVLFYDFYGKGLQKHPEIIVAKNLVAWYFKLLFKNSPQLHYVITTRGSVRFFASLLTLLKNKKVILRIGGSSLKESLAKTGPDKFFNILALKLCTAIIGVSEEICLTASKFASSKKIYHIPGFIPPENEKIDAPHDVLGFFGNAETKIVSTGLIFKKHEKDIYGLWDLLYSVNRIKEQLTKRNAKLCIVLDSSSTSNDLAVEAYSLELEKMGLSQLVYLYKSSGELWPILKTSNLFIRPTHADGDANSVREALFFGNTVVASDCASRPEGCMIFSTGNPDELAKKITKAIIMPRVNKFGIHRESAYNNINKTIKLLVKL